MVWVVWVWVWFREIDGRYICFLVMLFKLFMGFFMEVFRFVI